ncbi:unnamed protein product [Effrenium voratum]|nr:unnamed protein product [Effrenium voratum]
MAADADNFALHDVCQHDLLRNTDMDGRSGDDNVHQCANHGRILSHRFDLRLLAVSSCAFPRRISTGNRAQASCDRASVRRSGHVILGSGFTLCYCGLAVQQLPLLESLSLSIGILASVLCAMAVNMFITPTVLLAFPDFVSYGAPSKIMIEERNEEKEAAEANSKEGLMGPIVLACHSFGFRRESRTYSFDSAEDPDNRSFTDSSDDEEEALSPKSRRRKQRQAELQLRRQQALQDNVSGFWRWWSRLCTSPPCSCLVLLMVMAVSFLALTGSTAIHLDPSQDVTMDFTLLGPESSQTLETLDRVGKDFSKGIMGPTTVMFVARGQPGNVPRGHIFQPEVWNGMRTFMLKFIQKDLLAQGALGSIASPMYLSSPESDPIEVPVNSASTTDQMQVGPATPVPMQDLKYVMGEMLNEQRTAAVALITPNLRLTSPESLKWTRQLQDILDVQKNANLESPIDVYMVSQTAAMMDVELGVFNHVPRLILFSLVGCLIMTGLLFRSVMVAVRGLVTIVFTLAVVYMAAHCVFQLGALRKLGIPIGGEEGPSVPVSTFTIVLGLALDYDIFLLGRMCELRERGLPTLDAVADGVAQTGQVITCAGVMMAIAFGGMVLSEVPAMRQESWIFVLAVLLETPLWCEQW